MRPVVAFLPGSISSNLPQSPKSSCAPCWSSVFAAKSVVSSSNRTSSPTVSFERCWLSKMLLSSASTCWAKIFLSSLFASAAESRSESLDDRQDYAIVNWYPAVIAILYNIKSFLFCRRNRKSNYIRPLQDHLCSSNT